MPVAGARVLRRFKNAILIFLTLLDSATSAQDPTADSVGLKCGEASPGDLLEIQIHGLPPRPTESETLEVESGTPPVFMSSSGDSDAGTRLTAPVLEVLLLQPSPPAPTLGWSSLHKPVGTRGQGHSSSNSGSFVIVTTTVTEITRGLSWYIPLSLV